MKPDPIPEGIDRLARSLQACTAHFRNCEDQSGLDSAFDGLDDAEHLLDLCRSAGEPAIPPEKVLAALRTLDFLLRNRDIAGLTDYLEDTACPALKSRFGSVTLRDGN